MMQNHHRHRRNPGRLFITVKDVMNVLDCEKSKAYERMQHMRALYRKQPHQRITVMEFARYEDVEETEVRLRMI